MSRKELEVVKSILLKGRIQGNRPGRIQMYSKILLGHNFGKRERSKPKNGIGHKQKNKPWMKMSCWQVKANSGSIST